MFFELISIVLVSFGFFGGFEETKNNILIYLIIIFSIIFLGVVIYCLYGLLCKTYYEFTNNFIKIIKKGNLIKIINNNMIKYCEYYRFVTLFLGDSKGGKLIVYYLEDNIEKNIEISFSKKLIKQLGLKNVFIK